MEDSVNGAIPYAAAMSALAHKGCVQLHVQQGLDQGIEAATVTRLVRKALRNKQRTGVLARTRKDLHTIMTALHEAGIAFRAVNILPLNSRPEIRALRAVMRALLHPGDTESWAAILRMPCCGLTAADLFVLMAKDNRALWEILHDEDALSRLDTSARDRVMYVTQAIDPCLETGGNIDFTYFDERLKALYSVPDASIEAAQVELMTMHGAKGLQWDVVILPGLGTPPRSNDMPLLAFTEVPSDKDEMLLMSPKAETRGKDALYDLIRNIEKNKEHQESMRLLYVACTRAQTELHMLGHISEKDEKPAKHSFMELMYQHGKDYFGAEVQSMQPGEDEVTGERIPLTRIKTVPELLPVTICTNGHGEPEYGWAGPEAAPVGNSVHAALQRVAETGVENWNEVLTDEGVGLIIVNGRLVLKRVVWYPIT